MVSCLLLASAICRQSSNVSTCCALTGSNTATNARLNKYFLIFFRFSVAKVVYLPFLRKNGYIITYKKVIFREKTDNLTKFGHQTYQENNLKHLSASQIPNRGSMMLREQIWDNQPFRLCHARRYFRNRATSSSVMSFNRRMSILSSKSARFTSLPRGFLAARRTKSS